MQSSVSPPLTLKQFNAAPVNLDQLGLSPTNPDLDRVQAALSALRGRAASKATAAPIAIRHRTPGLTVADARELARCIAGSQLSQGVGIEGKKVALEVSVRMADALDAFHGYRDLVDAVALDLSQLDSYVDERSWAATPRHIQQLVEQFAVAERKSSLKQIDQEIANLTHMIDQIDRIGGTALELFERRRMQRAGLRPRAIEKAIGEMKADGRIGGATNAN